MQNKKGTRAWLSRVNLKSINPNRKIRCPKTKRKKPLKSKAVPIPGEETNPIIRLMMKSIKKASRKAFLLLFFIHIPIMLAPDKRAASLAGSKKKFYIYIKRPIQNGILSQNLFVKITPDGFCFFFIQRYRESIVGYLLKKQVKTPLWQTFIQGVV